MRDTRLACESVVGVRLAAMSVIWKKTLENLEKSINPAHVQAWLRPLKAELTTDNLTLTAANDFVASWVRNRYVENIEQAVQQVAQRAIAVQVVSGARQSDHAECSAPRRMEQHRLQLPEHTSEGIVNAARHATQWRFSFQDFVVGPCNELAFSAARGICRQQLVTDQFYICSSPGLGKTHLLQAMGQELSSQSNRSTVRLAYLSAEDFACRMVSALKRREMETFKARFREGVDVLLLEDIHFLQGKEKTQEELLATVKSLRAAGKKVVLTSSFLPKELPKLDSQLASQFCDGFMAVIEKPDFPTRMRILEAKASGLQIQIPRDVHELFANSIHSDIRLLESCLHNLVIKARLMKQRISHDLALEILQNYAPHQIKPDFDRIVSFICESFNLSHDSLRAKSRKKEYVLARNAIFFLARKHTSLSLKNIGEAFNRKHSTVIKGITQVEREMSRQSPLGKQVEHLVQTLETRAC